MPGRDDQQRSTSELEGPRHQNQSTRRNVIIKIEQHPNAVLRRVQGNLDFCTTRCVRVTIRSREVFFCYWPKIQRNYMLFLRKADSPSSESKKEIVKRRLQSGVKPISRSPQKKRSYDYFNKSVTPTGQRLLRLLVSTRKLVGSGFHTINN
jgi:hypothetical protein